MRPHARLERFCRRCGVEIGVAFLFRGFVQFEVGDRFVGHGDPHLAVGVFEVRLADWSEGVGLGGPGEGYDWPESNHGIWVDPMDNVWIGGNGADDSHALKFSHDAPERAAPDEQDRAVGQVQVGPDGWSPRAGTPRCRGCRRPKRGTLTRCGPRSSPGATLGSRSSGRGTPALLFGDARHRNGPAAARRPGCVVDSVAE